MPNHDEAFYRKNVEAILDRLLEKGWITEWGIHNDKYAFKWTAKGLERSHWVRDVAEELDLGPQGMTALLTICHLHADPA